MTATVAPEPSTAAGNLAWPGPRSVTRRASRRSGGPQRAAGPVRVVEAEDTGWDAGAAEDGADTDEPRTPWDELQAAAAPTRTATLAAASTRHDGGRAALRFERRTPPSQPAYCGTGHHRTQSPTALGRRHN